MGKNRVIFLKIKGEKYWNFSSQRRLIENTFLELRVENIYLETKRI